MSRWTGTTRRAVVALAFGLATAACASGGRPAADEYQESVLTAREIEGSGAITAYDAVRKLRANFLASRGTTSVSGTSSATPAVYLDGTPFGALASLRNIPAVNVATIRIYRSWEAQQKYGNGNMSGVIDVTTKHQ